MPISLATTYVATGETSNSATYETGIYQPRANTLLLGWIAHSQTAAPVTATLVERSGRFSWNWIAGITTGTYRLDVYRAMNNGTTPVSGSTTIGFSSSQSGCARGIMEITGVPISNDGSSAIQAIASLAWTSPSGGSHATLTGVSAFAKPSNGMFAGLTSSLNANPTAESGYSAAATHPGYNTPAQRLGMMWRATEETTPTFTWSGNATNRAVIGLELVSYGTNRNATRFGALAEAASRSQRYVRNAYQTLGEFFAVGRSIVTAGATYFRNLTLRYSGGTGGKYGNIGNYYFTGTNIADETGWTNGNMVYDTTESYEGGTCMAGFATADYVQRHINRDFEGTARLYVDFMYRFDNWSGGNKNIFYHYAGAGGDDQSLWLELDGDGTTARARMYSGFAPRDLVRDIPRGSWFNIRARVGGPAGSNVFEVKIGATTVTDTTGVGDGCGVFYLGDIGYQAQGTYRYDKVHVDSNGYPADVAAGGGMSFSASRVKTWIRLLSLIRPVYETVSRGRWLKRSATVSYSGNAGYATFDLFERADVGTCWLATGAGSPTQGIYEGGYYQDSLDSDEGAALATLWAGGSNVSVWATLEFIGGAYKWAGVTARGNESSWYVFYSGQGENTGLVLGRKRPSGAWQAFYEGAGSFTTGDTLRLDAYQYSTRVNLNAYKNGTLLCATYDDTALRLDSGYPGMGFWSVSDTPRVQEWYVEPYGGESAGGAMSFSASRTKSWARVLSLVRPVFETVSRGRWLKRTATLSYSGGAGYSTYDDFDRANGTAGAHWKRWSETANATISIYSNNGYIENCGGDDNVGMATYYSGGTNHSVWATMVREPVTAYSGVAARIATNVGWYAFYGEPTGSTVFGARHIVGGSWTNFYQPTLTWVDGDVLRLDAYDFGTRVNLDFYKNGTLLCATYDDSGARLTSGVPGIQTWSASSSHFYQYWGAADIGGGGGGQQMSSVSRIKTFTRTITNAISPLFSLAQEVIGGVGPTVRNAAFAIVNSSVVKRSASYVRANSLSRGSNLVLARLAHRLRSVALVRAGVLAVSRVRALFRTANSYRPVASSVRYLRGLLRRVLLSRQQYSAARRIASYIRRISGAVSRAIAVGRSISGGLTLRTVALLRATTETVSRRASYIRRISIQRALSSVLSRAASTVRTVGMALSRVSSVRYQRWYVRTAARVGTSRAVAAYKRWLIRTVSTARSVIARVGRSISGGLTLRSLAVLIPPSSRVSRIGRYIRRVSLTGSIRAIIDRSRRTARSMISGVRSTFSVRRLSWRVRNASLYRVPVYSVRRVARYLRDVAILRPASYVASRVIGFTRYVVTQMPLSHLVSQARLTGELVLNFISKTVPVNVFKVTSAAVDNIRNVFVEINKFVSKR